MIPEYLNSNLSSTHYSRQTVKFIKPENCNGESDLFQTKWWDYRVVGEDSGTFRPLHPMEATILFHVYYRDELTYASKRRDEFAIGMLLRERDLFKLDKKFIAGLWKARRVADKHGIPYDFYCRQAMSYADKYNRKRLPSPQSLSSAVNMYPEKANSLSMVDFIVRRWAEYYRERLPTAEGAFYKIENYNQHPYQVEHIKLIMEIIRNGIDKAIDIGYYVYEKGLISEDFIRATFKGEAENLLVKARRYASYELELL